MSSAATGRSEAHSAKTSSDAVNSSRNSPITSTIPSTRTPSESSARVASGRASSVKTARRSTSIMRKLNAETIETARTSASSTRTPSARNSSARALVPTAPPWVMFTPSTPSTSSSGAPTRRLSSAFRR
ncbi:hypothetical protein FM106_00350 [Brachybacterium faecium]|nr:hypothetical protein FM106_00350 [Brachybacterium faecium]